MILDLIIVIAYFTTIVLVALSGRKSMDISGEEYFLSSRNLRWPSIALSTIATNISGYQFMGMMGSAYLYGLAQANLEINAMQGLWFAAFIFIPLYWKDKVITVTQFIKKRLGKWVALAYSVANLLLFSTVILGAALFWGAYAAELVFTDMLMFISDNRLVRVGSIMVVLGLISATYTYYGGLSAVVRTDIIQFVILVGGGTIMLFTAIYYLGGWGELYRKTPELMHLHLPADHEKLPWIGILGMFLLNINYWCANQSVVQRSLAARSLKDVQIGLMVGGLLKYYMALIIIIPGIALAGILVDNPLAEPDKAFPYIVTEYLPAGVRGLILCALFASLMSTVDSVFNSLATLFSIDIYKEYINPEATDRQVVEAARKTIVVTLITGVCMGFYLLYVKFLDPQAAFTHTLNEIRYYVNCGIVAIICACAFLILPNHRIGLFAFLFTIPLHLILKYFFPEMNYFVRAMFVILIAFAIIAVPSIIQHGMKSPKAYFTAYSRQIMLIGLGLLSSLGVLHIIFH